MYALETWRKEAARQQQHKIVDQKDENIGGCVFALGRRSVRVGNCVLLLVVDMECGDGIKRA